MSPRLWSQGDKVIIILPGLLFLNVLPPPALGDLRWFEDVSLTILALWVVTVELNTQHGVQAVDGVGRVPPLHESSGRGRSEEVRWREGGRWRGSHALQCSDNFITLLI